MDRTAAKGATLPAYPIPPTPKEAAAIKSPAIAITRSTSSLAANVLPQTSLTSSGTSLPPLSFLQPSSPLDSTTEKVIEAAQRTAFEDNDSPTPASQLSVTDAPALPPQVQPTPLSTQVTHPSTTPPQPQPAAVVPAAAQQQSKEEVKVAPPIKIPSFPVLDDIDKILVKGNDVWKPNIDAVIDKILDSMTVSLTFEEIEVQTISIAISLERLKEQVTVSLEVAKHRDTTKSYIAYLHQEHTDLLTTINTFNSGNFKRQLQNAKAALNVRPPVSNDSELDPKIALQANTNQIQNHKLHLARLEEYEKKIALRNTEVNTLLLLLEAEGQKDSVGSFGFSARPKLITDDNESDFVKDCRKFLTHVMYVKESTENIILATAKHEPNIHQATIDFHNYGLLYIELKEQNAKVKEAIEAKLKTLNEKIKKFSTGLSTDELPRVHASIEKVTIEAIRERAETRFKQVEINLKSLIDIYDNKGASESLVERGKKLGAKKGYLGHQELKLVKPE